MPVWLMFIPVAAIIQGIIVLFVAVGQWITGTYYALAPHDGREGGRIEIVRSNDRPDSMRIEATLADGRLYTASFHAGARRAIVRSAPARDGRESRPAVTVHLYAQDGSEMLCRFTDGASYGASGGRCATADGRGFDIVAVAAAVRPDGAPVPPSPRG